jgi:hypothetical protein
MRATVTTSVLRDPVVLVALLGWLMSASLFLSFHLVLESVSLGESRWPLWLQEAILGMQLLAMVLCATSSLGRSAANLKRGNRQLPSIAAIALSIPMLALACLLGYLLVWLWQWASPLSQS